MVRIHFLLFLAWAPSLVWAFRTPIFSIPHEPSVAHSFFESILRDDSLEMKLVTDFKALRKERNSVDYQPATLFYSDKAGVGRKMEIEVRPRGKMRRRVCDTPPLMIRLPGEGTRTIKMVTMCKNSPRFEQYLLREYFAYKLYNMLTPVSFRVQLAKIDFVDTNGKHPLPKSFAFLIENEKDMASRVNGFPLSSAVATPDKLRTSEVELFCMFQYMVGNTDWFPIPAHNLVILGLDGHIYPTLVPYDFDYSGLVNAPYATPNSRLKLPDVTNRYYQGMKRGKEETITTIQQFIDRKSQIISYCFNFPYFDKKSKKHVARYIADFYKIIEKPKLIKQEIFNHSDMWLKL